MFQARRPAGFDLVGVVILKSRSATATSVTLAYGAPPVASLLARSQTLKPNDTSASTTARPDATSPTRIAPSDLSRTSTRDEILITRRCHPRTDGPTTTTPGRQMMLWSLRAVIIEPSLDPDRPGLGGRNVFRLGSAPRRPAGHLLGLRVHHFWPAHRAKPGQPGGSTVGLADGSFSGLTLAGLRAAPSTQQYSMREPPAVSAGRRSTSPRRRGRPSDPAPRRTPSGSSHPALLR